jgi:arginine utilization protein RocB
MADFAKELVSIPSINGTPGERNIAEHIEAELRKFPYFQAHPDQVILQVLGDTERRANVIALLKGEKAPCEDTVIMHGHIDTVGVDDYGLIKEFAFNADALPDKIRELTEDPDVVADLDTGDWLFGRGIADMKSGVAVNFVLLKHYAQHPEKLAGNIIFMANPVEENQHTGIMTALSVLKELRDKENFKYKIAVNTDTCSPLYPGDPAKYFDAGAIGKILPCFYIIGKPTHVSAGFEGFSASLTAAEIVRIMDGNVELLDEALGQRTAPPCVLKMKDLKPTYDVQTTIAAFVYFNYFVLSTSLKDLIDRFKQIGMDALESVLTYTDEQYAKFCEGAEYEEYKKIDLPLQSLSYSELYEKAAGIAGEASVEKIVSDVTKAGLAENIDKRELQRMIVGELCTAARINTPTVIAFIAPPYCPRNTANPEDSEESALFDMVEKLIEEKSAEHGSILKLRHFFPALTDSSYLKIDDDDESVQCLVDNFPNFRGIYNVPVELIKELSIPAFNFGVYGKDAHKWTERVNAPYSFGILPDIIMTALQRLLTIDD